MAVERRGDIIEGDADRQPLRREELEASPKAFAIPKRAVFAAWQRDPGHGAGMTDQHSYSDSGVEKKDRPSRR